MRDIDPVKTEEFLRWLRLKGLNVQDQGALGISVRDQDRHLCLGVLIMPQTYSCNAGKWAQYGGYGWATRFAQTDPKLKELLDEIQNKTPYLHNTSG